jgi:hypothetical protein
LHFEGGHDFGIEIGPWARRLLLWVFFIIRKDLLMH